MNRIEKNKCVSSCPYLKITSAKAITLGLLGYPFLTLYSSPLAAGSYVSAEEACDNPLSSGCDPAQGD